MRKLIIALLMGLIAISLLVSSAYGFRFGKTDSGSPSASAYSNILLANNYTITVLDGFFWRISAVHIQVNGTQTDSAIKIGVYDSTRVFIASTAWLTVGVSGATGEWEETTINIDLLAGNYYFAVVYVNATYGMYEAAPDGIYAFLEDPSTDLPGQLTLADWSAQQLCLYVDYDIVPFGPDQQIVSVTTVQDVNWMAFIVLLAFAFLNVVLMLIPRIYVLNFVVGALTLAISAATVNDATLPVQPYFSLIVALLSVLGILRAASLLRDSW